MENVIFYGIQLIIAILTFVLGRFVFPKLKMLTMDSNNDFINAISSWVYNFVINAKNQFGDDAEGIEKRDWVFDNVKKLLAKWKIELTDAQIYALIESAYDQMKNNTVTILTDEVKEFDPDKTESK